MSEGLKRHVSPWHEGELALQRSVGVIEHMDAVGRRVLRNFLLDQHREFFPLLPFVVIGAVDPEGLPGRPSGLAGQAFWLRPIPQR